MSKNDRLSRVCYAATKGQTRCEAGAQSCGTPCREPAGLPGRSSLLLWCWFLGKLGKALGKAFGGCKPVSHWKVKSRGLVEAMTITVGLVLLLLNPPPLAGSDLRELVLLIPLQIVADWLVIYVTFGGVSVGTAVTLATFLIFGPGAAAWMGALGQLVGNGLLKRGRRPMAILGNMAVISISMAAAAMSFYWAGGQTGSSGVWSPDSIWPIAFFIVTFFAVNHLVVNANLAVRLPSYRIQFALEAARWDFTTYLITVPFALLMVGLYSQGIIYMVFVAVPLLLLGQILALYKRLGQTTRVLEVAAQLSSMLDLDVLLRRILEAAQGVTKANTCMLTLRDPDDEALIPKVVLSDVAVQVIEGQKLHFSAGGINVLVAQTGVPEIVHDTRKDPRVRHIPPLELDDRSLMVVPMKNGDRVIGTISLTAPGTHSFLPEHVKLVSILANQAAVAIENAQLYARLESAAITNSLTGLFNYRYFYQRLAEELEKAKPTKSQLTLIILDIDNFKQYNDVYGHLVGDEVLRQVARVIAAHMGARGVVARYGGEEFSILISEPLPVAETLVEEIRQAVAQHKFTFQDYTIQGITLSAGIANYPEHADTEKELMDKADQALYWGSKQRGRNRVTIYSPEFDARLYVDQLTGLYTYQYFHHRLDDELKTSAERGTPVSLILMDIKNMNGINEKYGFDAGDEVLRTVSYLIKKQIRLNDMAARYSADDFVLLFPGVKGEDARVMSDRLRRTIEEHRVKVGKGESLAIPLRIMVLTYQGPESAEQDVAAIIDQALTDLGKQ